jgi:hypothetical protein
MSTIPNHVA